MANQGLKSKLNKIRRIFDVDTILRQNIDNQVIVNYYTDSHLGYKTFHSSAGSLHMSLNFDGKFNKEGYYGQPKIVQKHIDETHPTSVLELASGKGFNSIFLAKQNRGTTFVGIDLTPKHVEIAKNKAKGIANLSFEIEDFQDLSFPSETFDLVFVFESLCHASDMPKAMSEVHRVLKKDGRFIVTDAFRNSGFDQFDSDMRLAARLVEVSMAVDRFWEIDKWLEAAEKDGFSILNVEDISEAIMPNLMKFQYLARGYFKLPIISNALLRVLPAHLVKNSIAGLLVPITVRAGAHGYFVIILGRD